MSEREVTADDRRARIPSAVPGCDLRQLPLTPAEAYVFSRIDGSMNEADLIVCVGMDALAVTMALERLAALGAIRFTAAKRTESRTQPSARQEPSGSPPRFQGSDPRRSDVVMKSAAAPASAAPRGSPSGLAPRASALPGAASPHLTPAPASRTSAGPGTASPRLTPAPPPSSSAPDTGPPTSRRVTPVPSAYQPASTRPGDLHHVKRYLEAAKLAVDDGNLPGATNFYRLAQQLAPGDPAIRTALDECSAVTAEVKAVSEKATMLVQRGDAAAREQRWHEAATNYEEAALLVPKDAAVLHKAAGSLYRCDDFRVAVEFAQRAVSLAPGRFDTWLLLAHIHHGSGSIGPARHALNEARRLSPGDERVARLDAKMPR